MPTEFVPRERWTQEQWENATPEQRKAHWLATSDRPPLGISVFGDPEVLEPDQEVPSIPPDNTRTDFARPSNLAFDTWPNRSEVATVIVENLRFEDWDSVWIQETWKDWYAQFRFTCVDAVNVHDPAFPTRVWETLRFLPGEECQIFLGSLQAVHGVIISRQAAYDANSHGVEISGKTMSWFAARASIIDDKSRYEGSFLEIAAKVLAPTGVGWRVVGTIKNKPFKPAVSPKPGENISAFLESLARDRDVRIGSDRYGRIVFIGQHVAPIVCDLIEGVNILKCQCRISQEWWWSELITRGQSAGSDQLLMRMAAEQEARGPGGLSRYSPLLIPMEHPVWTLDEVVMRNNFEQKWTNGTGIECTITVQGWFAPDGQLWEAGQNVVVTSPMAALDREILKAETVTFTQDRKSGSLTTLVLVPPWKLDDQTGVAPGRVRPPWYVLPGGSTPNTEPATTSPTFRPRFDVPPFIPPEGGG